MPKARALDALRIRRLILSFAWTASALAMPLEKGGAQYKSHGKVEAEPKYRTARPAYMTDAQLIATLSSAHQGNLRGVTTSRVYLDPATGRLAFEYTTTADGLNNRPIIRAALDGLWEPVTIFQAGADASGQSGALDAAAEWTDGDPFYIARSEFPPYSPYWVFRDLVPPNQTLGTTLGPLNRSARVWFETDAGSIAVTRIGYLDSGQIGQADALVPSPVPDRDADGALNAFDNCPNTPNSSQLDSDLDRVGDACDACAQTPLGTVVNARGCPVTPGDADRDGDVDIVDYERFVECMTGPDLGPVESSCAPMDFDEDDDVDQVDFAVFQRCVSGAGVPADADCAD